MKAKKFTKKPVTIEAMKFEYTVKSLGDISDFMGQEFLETSKARHPGALAELVIPTLEDGKEGQVKHVATEGDWIIKGIKGEFYPCKPDIFEATYSQDRHY